jgi:AmiR/NasT family two-component response regulator
MAMGILMASGRSTQEQAFAALRRASQHLNRKLRDVAADVVETGQLPERRSRGPAD